MLNPAVILSITSVIEEKLPHLNCMLQDDMDSLLDWAETIIISNNDEIFKSVRVRDGQAVIDLVRIKELAKILKKKFCIFRHTEELKMILVYLV